MKEENKDEGGSSDGATGGSGWRMPLAFVVVMVVGLPAAYLGGYFSWVRDWQPVGGGCQPNPCHELVYCLWSPMLNWDAERYRATACREISGTWEDAEGRRLTVRLDADWCKVRSEAFQELEGVWLLDRRASWSGLKSCHKVYFAVMDPDEAVLGDHILIVVKEGTLHVFARRMPEGCSGWEHGFAKVGPEAQVAMEGK